MASKYRCEGLTEESLKPVFENGMDLLRGLNNRVEPEQLEDHQGHRVWHVKMYFPLMLENRSVIACEYKGQTSGGLTCIIVSSLGNESLY